MKTKRPKTPTPEQIREHIARHFDWKADDVQKKDGSYGGYITGCTYRWVAGLVRKCPLPEPVAPAPAPTVPAHKVPGYSGPCRCGSLSDLDCTCG